MLKKKCGSWRLCEDFRGLNDKTKPDRYPIPFVTDFTHQLAGCTIFSKIDLVRGYHQVPIEQSDIEKTAIVTPFGFGYRISCVRADRRKIILSWTASQESIKRIRIRCNLIQRNFLRGRVEKKIIIESQNCNVKETTRLILLLIWNTLINVKYTLINVKYLNRC